MACLVFQILLLSSFKVSFISIFAAGYKQNNLIMSNITFTMIKPEAVAEGNIGAITKMIEEAGFRVVAMKKTQLTSERAGQFYAVHKERPFYNDLCKYMSSGPIVAMVLEKENAVTDF